MEARLSSPVNETRTFPTERLVDDFKLAVQCAGDRARESARAADKAVRDHPYQTIGIAVGLGAVIGALACRWWSTRG